jgi:hypothetical protein
MLSAAGLAAMMVASGVKATPSTNIWNPTTDIQDKRTYHLDIDNYFNFEKLKSKGSDNIPTDVGLLYGLGTGFEVGVDVNEASLNPFLFNVKWGQPEKGKMPAYAVGIQGLGLTSSSNAAILYGLASKNFTKPGRFTLGAYYGQPNVLRVNAAGGRSGDNAGVIAEWDRSFGDKWWASVDCASGVNTYGEISVGGAYNFTKSVSVIVGLVHFNSSAHYANPDTITTQLDINF